MIYLLDTDTLIFMIRGLKSSNRHQASRERAQKLVDRCRQTQADGDTLAVSAITVAELEFGARQSDRPDDELRAMHKVLSPFDRVDFDAIQAPARYGDVRHDLEAVGQPIGAMDLLIAAHALSLQATLVTNNTAHFARVGGLPVENWC
jgi:tRNA(fMet)-specific endonuclease VapC